MFYLCFFFNNAVAHQLMVWDWKGIDDVNGFSIATQSSYPVKFTRWITNLVWLPALLRWKCNAVKWSKTGVSTPMNTVSCFDWRVTQRVWSFGACCIAFFTRGVSDVVANLNLGIDLAESSLVCMKSWSGLAGIYFISLVGNIYEGSQGRFRGETWV